MFTVDDFVGVILLIWFFPAFIAIIAVTFDQFLIPFIPKFYTLCIFVTFNILSLLLGLFGIYHTYGFLNTYITNIYTFLLTISLTIFFHVLLIDHFYSISYTFQYKIYNCLYITKTFYHLNPRFHRNFNIKQLQYPTCFLLLFNVGLHQLVMYVQSLMALTLFYKISSFNKQIQYLLKLNLTLYLP